MIKKIFFLFALLVMLSGCSMLNPDVEESQGGVPAYSDDEFLEEVMNVDKEQLEKNMQERQTQQTQTNQELPIEDLAGVYSQAIIKTNLGDITVEFYGDESPLTVSNFLTLAKKGFYDGTLFHRIIDDFMIQGGDPLSKEDNWAIHGTGGPGYKFKDEINDHELVRGSFAMANAGPNTNGSQFFIVTKDETPWLDGKHTNFGRVVDGMEVVEKIEAVETNQNDHPVDDIVIESIELIAK